MKFLKAADRQAVNRLSTPQTEEAQMKRKQAQYPPGWDEERVRKVLAHYEEQTEEEAVAEDEASFEDATRTVMEIPKELVPVVRELIAKHQA